MRLPEEISVGDVLRAVEGSPAPVEARRGPGRRNGDETHELGELWEEIGKAVSAGGGRGGFCGPAAPAPPGRPAGGGGGHQLNPPPRHRRWGAGWGREGDGEGEG